MEIPNYLIIEFFAGSLALLAAFLLFGKPLQETPAKERLKFPDFAKGAAMLGVICVHAAGVAIWGEQYKEAFGFAIPAFVLFSGYLLARKYTGKMDIGKYLVGVLLRIVPLYAAFTLVQHVFRSGFSIGLPRLAYELAFGGAENGSYYFIPLILQFYLLFPLLQKYRGIALSSPALIAVWAFTLLFSYLTYLWQVPDWNSNQMAIAFFGRYAVFFLLGMWLAFRGFGGMRPRTSALLAAVFFAIGASLGALNGQFYLGYVFQLGVVFALHAIYHAGNEALGRSGIANAFAALGKNSLFIYMIHASIIYGLLGGLPLGWEGPLGYVSLVLLAAGISYAASAAFSSIMRLLFPARR